MEILVENMCIESLEEIDSKIESTVAEISNFLRNITEQRADESEQNIKGESDLIGFLITMLDFFQQNPETGFEELLLPHLGEIRLQNGYKLIERTSSEFPEEDLKIVSWYKLCHHIESYVGSRMMSTELRNVSNPLNGRYVTWMNYLQMLKDVFTPAKLWDFHVTVRFQYIQELSCQCFAEEPNDPICLQCLFSFCYELFVEDAQVIGLGCFKNLVITWHDLYIIYNKILSSAVKTAVEAVGLVTSTAISEGNVPRYFKCFFRPSSVNVLGNLARQNEPFPLNLRVSDNDNIKNGAASIVLGLIENLHSFENKIINLMTMDSSNFKVNSNPILIPLPNESPEQSPEHRTTMSNEEFPWLWDWRSLITNKGLLTFLQRRIQEYISICVAVACTEEMRQFRRTSSLNKTLVQCPRTKEKFWILASVNTVLKNLNLFLPVLSASQGSLSPFCSSFSHVIHTYLIDLVSHIKLLVQLNNTFSGDISHLSILLSSCYVLKLALRYYKVKASGKDSGQLDSIIASIDKSLHTEADIVQLTLITWYRKAVLCGILHDGESHNWQETKPFLEGENISYSLRMWNLFLKSMLFEINNKLPQETAHEISFKVFCESLSFLVSRYAKAEPSECGTVQIRAEITFILFCAMEYLPAFCSSLEELLGIQDTSKLKYPISRYLHSHCSSLLITLTVLTSPIQIMYKVFKTGFPTVPVDKRPKNEIAPWLPWLHPALLSQSKDGSHISSISVWLSVKLVISHNLFSPLPLIHALTMHTCTLSILLATESSRLPAESNEQKTTLLSSILTVIAHCVHQPNAIANVLVPVIETCGGWESFNGHPVVTSNENSNVWWFHSLRTFLYPCVRSIICGAVSPMLNGSSVLESPLFSEWKTMYLHLRRVVRCCCKNSSTVERNVTLALCSLEILQGVANNVYTLPLPIQVCLFELQNFLTKHKSNVRSLGGCVALQIITDIVFNSLNNPTIMESILGLELSESMVKLCSEIADYFVCLVTPKVKFQNHDLPPACREKAQGYLLQIHGFFKHCNPKKVSERTMDDVDYLPLVHYNLQREEDSTEQLHFLFRIICLNSKWIQKSLGISDVLSNEPRVNSLSPPSPLPNEFQEAQLPPVNPEDSESIWIGEDISSCNLPLSELQNLQVPSEYVFSLILPDDPDEKYFNCLEEVSKIGTNSYEYTHLTGFTYFWEPLLTHLPLLGLSEEGFKTLLSHRWDVNSQDVLTETDSKCVQALRSQYGLEKISAE